jgi:transcriptional regulator with XRE-family HTH domain
MSINEGERATAAAGARAVPTDSFGNRLMLARAYAGHLSIREAADLCDIGRGAWTNWERGARPVDMLEITEAISEKLGVDREWLLFGGPLAKQELARRLGRRGRGVTSTLLPGMDLNTGQRLGGRPAGHPINHRRPEATRRPARLSPPIAV